MRSLVYSQQRTMSEVPFAVAEQAVMLTNPSAAIAVVALAIHVALCAYPIREVAATLLVVVLGTRELGSFLCS